MRERDGGGMKDSRGKVSRALAKHVQSAKGHNGRIGSNWDDRWFNGSVF